MYYKKQMQNASSLSMLFLDVKLIGYLKWYLFLNTRGIQEGFFFLPFNGSALSPWMPPIWKVSPAAFLNTGGIQGGEFFIFLTTYINDTFSWFKKMFILKIFSSMKALKLRYSRRKIEEFKEEIQIIISKGGRQRLLME